MVAIGVSGHRDLIDLAAVSNAIDEVLTKILAAFGGNTLQVISPLAEGADRLVVWRAMENYSVRLIVPLPLEMSDYMLDFKSISSKSEFITLLEQAAHVIELPAEKTREASYLAAGIYVLDNSEVLIAVWNGQPNRGIGGTGQIVAQARQQKIPLAWVFARNKGGPTKTPALRNKLQGEVSYENFP